MPGASNLSAAIEPLREAAPSTVSSATTLAPGPRLVEDIQFLISCGSDKKTLRGVASNVLTRYTHMLRFERGRPYNFSQWDYRLDASRDEPIGHFADRSVRAVDESEAVIAIVGHGVPRTTEIEIRHVYDLRKVGTNKELFFFVHRPHGQTAGTGHKPLGLFLEELKGDYAVEKIYHEVEDKIDFQASLILDMMPFVVARTADAFGPLGEGRPSRVA